jgi:hypothetical protein
MTSETAGLLYTNMAIPSVYVAVNKPHSDTFPSGCNFRINVQTETTFRAKTMIFIFSDYVDKRVIRWRGNMQSPQPE